MGYGRCTPRGFVKAEGGGWEGSAPTSVHGKVSAAGRFFYAKKVKTFAHPTGLVARWTLPFAFSNADPRAAVILTGGSASVPCADFNGTMEFIDPYDPEDPLDTLTDLTCAYPIAPVVQIVRRLGATLAYTPRGDLETEDFSWGSGGSDGALGIYTVEVSVWEVKVRITIGVGRPAGRPPGFAAVAFAKAAMILGPGFDSIASVPSIDITAVAATPCGTKVDVYIVKPMSQPPLDDTEPAWCATPGIIDPAQCITCRAVGVEMQVTVDLADLFTACERCDLVVASDCCPVGGGFLPSPATIPGTTMLGWRETPVSVNWRRETVGTGIALQNVVETVTVASTLKWSNAGGCVIAALNAIANGRGEYRRSGTVDGVPIPTVTRGVEVIGLLFQNENDVPIEWRPPFPYGEAAMTLFIRSDFAVPGSVVNLWKVRWARDGADSTIEGVGPPESVTPLRRISTAGFTREQSNVEGNLTWTDVFWASVGPLFPCVEAPPPGGGGGEEEAFVVVGAGSGGSGGCSGCGGGIA